MIIHNNNYPFSCPTNITSIFSISPLIPEANTISQVLVSDSKVAKLVKAIFTSSKKSLAETLLLLPFVNEGEIGKSLFSFILWRFVFVPDGKRNKSGEDLFFSLWIRKFPIEVPGTQPEITLKNKKIK